MDANAVPCCVGPRRIVLNFQYKLEHFLRWQRLLLLLLLLLLLILLLTKSSLPSCLAFPKRWTERHAEYKQNESFVPCPPFGLTWY